VDGCLGISFRFAERLVFGGIRAAQSLYVMPAYVTAGACRSGSPMRQLQPGQPNHAPPGGAQPWHSELAILTALPFQAVLRLALRQTEGLIGSIMRLLGLDLPVPPGRDPGCTPASIGQQPQCWSQCRARASAGG